MIFMVTAPSPAKIKAQELLADKNRQEDLSLAADMPIPSGRSRIGTDDPDVAKALVEILRQHTPPDEGNSVVLDDTKVMGEWACRVMAPTEIIEKARTTVQGQSKTA